MASLDDKVTASKYVNRLQTGYRGASQRSRTALRSWGNDNADITTVVQALRHGVALGKDQKEASVTQADAKVERATYGCQVLWNIKLYHFDLLKPCNITDIPRWIVRARKQFVQDDTSQMSLKAGKVERGQI